MNPAAGLVASSKPSFCRKLSACDVPSSAYRDISVVLGANFKCFVGGCRLTAKTDSEVFSNLSEVWHFHPLFSTGSGWSLLKAQLSPKPVRKTLLSLHGQIGAATGHCSPQPQMLSFLTQAILSHALDFGEAGSNSWRLSQEAAALDVLQCLFTTYICSVAIDLYSRQSPPQRGRFRSSVSSKQNQAPLYFALS